MVRWVIECTETKNCSDKFTKGCCYAVDETGTIIDDYGKAGSIKNIIDFDSWYKSCNWVSYKFILKAEFPIKIKVKKSEVMDILESKYGVPKDLIEIV